jgi:hypothetical protein
VKLSLVKIWVVVGKNQVRSLWTDVEKGLLWRAIGLGLVVGMVEVECLE